jgi:hypothetical protein
MGLEEFATFTAIGIGGWMGYATANGTVPPYRGELMVGYATLCGAGSAVFDHGKDSEFIGGLTFTAAMQGIGFGIGYLIGRWT